MATTVPITRAEVEDFLAAEAELLDAWRLEEWLGLFLADAIYEIPTPDAGDAPSTAAQFYIADDAELLRVRVKRLQSRHAHAEQPRSVTHRMIGLARVTAASGDLVAVPGDLVRVRATFIVHRVRDGHVDPYIGWYDHLLLPTGAGLRFRRRRSVLAADQLKPGSRLSFIL